MTLKEYVFKQFNQYHKGKGFPTKRVWLLNDVQHNHDALCTDREMRAAYEDLPICGSSQGLYLPETQAEIDEQVEIHKKKIMAYWRKIKILKQYKISTDSVQKELF